MRKKRNQMKAFLLVSCMAVSFVMVDGSVSGAESGGAKALQAMGNASEKAVAEQVKAFQKEDALQQDAKDAYAELMDVVEESAAVEKNYAGAYIDDENQLVVNLTTSSEKVQDIVQENTESQEVEFREREYSYDELMGVSNQIAEAISDTKYMELVSSISVSQKQNAVLVKMRDSSYEDDFRADICDEACVRIQKSSCDMKPLKTNLMPGGYIGIYEPQKKAGYSIGWRGWRMNNAGNYTEGLVTAGHGNRVGEVARTYGNHLFGKFVKRRFGGSLDATFVQRTSDKFDVSNTIKFSGSSLKAGYYVVSSSLCEGQKVYKVGMKTGLTQGKITNPGHKTYYKEFEGAPITEFSDFVEADYFCDNGDSGGLVYMDVNGSYVMVGIVASGFVAAITGEVISDFVKAENIINQMEIYPY